MGDFYEMKGSICGETLPKVKNVDLGRGGVELFIGFSALETLPNECFSRLRREE